MRLPANWRDLYDVRTAAWRRNPVDVPRGRNSRQQRHDGYTARGTEIEFTFNPTRPWRFLANVSKQDTVQSEVVPHTVAFIHRLKPALDALSGRLMAISR